MTANTGEVPDGCRECKRLVLEAHRARATGDRSRETDCTVLLRRHTTSVHMKAANS